MSNHKTPNFAYGNFPTERDLICVKEDLLRKSPNSINRTFLNANIMWLRPNFIFYSQSLNKSEEVKQWK